MRAALAFGFLAALFPALVMAQTGAAPSPAAPSSRPAPSSAAPPQGAPPQVAPPQTAAPARTKGGNITRDEYIERAKRSAEKRFDRMDTDHDGILTPEERAAGRTTRRSSKSQ